MGRRSRCVVDAHVDRAETPQHSRGSSPSSAHWSRRATKTSALRILPLSTRPGRLSRHVALEAAGGCLGRRRFDAGYCYQYGIGARKDIATARRLFRRAIAARDITAYGKEEAAYHLGLTYLDAGKPKLGVPFFERAAADGDYPEATEVLEQIRSRGKIQACRCRRHLNKDLRGHVSGGVHGR